MESSRLNKQSGSSGGLFLASRVSQDDCQPPSRASPQFLISLCRGMCKLMCLLKQISVNNLDEHICDDETSFVEQPCALASHK